MGTMGLIATLGLACIAFGIVAISGHQPYPIWFPPLVTGVIFVGLMIALLPIVRGRYVQS